MRPTRRSEAEPAMKAPAASPDDTAIKDLAAYYAEQAPQPPNGSEDP